jgi:hypothetical protein
MTRRAVTYLRLADVHGIDQPTSPRIDRSVMPLPDQVLCLHEPELPRHHATISRTEDIRLLAFAV